MNGFIIATMLLSGGSAVAMQNQEVNQAVNHTANKVMLQVGNMFKGSRLENIRENGFTGPSEAFLSTLTEDQVFQITSAIDVINATYDWANMTDEEIRDALVLVKAEMEALYAELGIEAPMIQTQTRTQTRTRIQSKTQTQSRYRDNENCNHDSNAGASEGEVVTGNGV